MLSYMRKNANSTVVWLIIGAIAVVFIFFGIGGGGNNVKMISVNGEEVSLGEYDEMVKAVFRAQGNNFSPEAEQVVKLTAVSELVGRLLMKQFARDAGLAPTDWAVGQNIASIAEFQVDGHFDRARYEAELATMRINKARFEDSTRQEILTSRVANLLGGLSQVYQPEALEIFHFQEDQAAYDYLFFPAAVHRAGLRPGDGQLTAYYAANQENWRVPAKLKVEYVEIRPADFLGQVSVSEDVLRDYYTENEYRFSSPEAVEVSHILFKFPKMNPNEAEKALTLDRAKAGFERAKIEDFAGLARELSEDPGSGPQGGALGTIVKGMTFAKFEEAAFSAPVGEVLPPVETDIGYHLIKVAEHRQAGSRGFDEVRGELENELKAGQAHQAAINQLEDLIIRTETNPKLADAAASMGLQVSVSPEFTQADPPDFFADDSDAVRQAFSAPVGRVVSSPVESEDQMVLYAPLERQESHIPPLAEVKEAVTEAWIAAEAGARARAEALAFLQKAQTEGWPAAAEGSGPAESGRTELSSRSGLIGQAPFEKVNPLDLFAAIHSVGRAGEISPLTVPGELDGQAGSFVLALAAYEPADEGLFEGPAGRTFTSMMSMNKGNLMYQVWRGELYEASKENILVPQEFIN